MLSAHLEDHDTVGQWMAHHLAELVAAAQDDATTTVEQRQQIVETILKVWAYRRYYPGRGPLKEFASVFKALDRLGDDSSWKFFRFSNEDIELPDPSASDLPLVATAAELERLARETLVRLIWLAAHKAKEQNQKWLEVADKVTSNLESEVTTTLWDLRRRVARRRLRAVQGDPTDVTETPNEDSGTCSGSEEKAENLTEGSTAEDVVVSGFDEGDADPFDNENDERASDALSDVNHAKRLREMANLLNKVADALNAPNTPG